MLPLILLLLLPSLLLADPSPLNTPDNPWGEYAADCLVDKPSLWDESRIETHYRNGFYSYDTRSTSIRRRMIDGERWQRNLDRGCPPQSTSRKRWPIRSVETEHGTCSLMVGVPDKLTEPYRTEIKAMADMTGIQLEQLTLLNLFYEIAAMCTSLVAINHEGQVFHGRNLDFGLFYLWDTEEKTWDLTLRLRDLVIQCEFVKDGKLLFKAVTFAGHLGIMTAVRPGAYSVSINTRFGSSLDTMTNFFLTGLDPDQQFVVYANRDMMTNYATFEEAKNYIENIGILRRAYFTMGSVDGGIVVTRAFNGTDHEAIINTMDPSGNGWYVLQTNYDWNEPDIYLDDRTKPGNHCMQKLGRKRVTKEGIFQVMSSQTTLNKATVYTTVMEIKTGALYTFKQSCADPCWFI